VNNKYSNLKIAWFPDKLKSLLEEKISAPICVRIKPTNRCCHNCYFCVYNYGFSKMHEHVNRQDEIPVEIMMEILEDLAAIGVKAVTYSGGGEPLVHKNSETILQKTIDCKLDLSMLTNGQELEGKKAELMTGAKWIRISMDYWNGMMFADTRKVAPKFFYKILNNIKKFAAVNKNCDLGVNYIITKKNYTTLFEAFDFITSLGVDNIRFSPLWVPDFSLYHQNIKETVLSQLNQIYRRTPKGISVYDTYKIAPEVTTRTYNRCYFLQIVPVIGADLNIYNCHNKAYDSNGIIGSIKNRKFSDVWFSEETLNYFKTFRPDLICNHQCANDIKNKHIHEILTCSEDNYV
jgi:MoaA/NifB/PqqE/SkfB family radical SAM enzyme